MSRLSSALCVALLALVVFAASARAQEANLLVAKDFEEDYVVLGRDLKVVFTCHNIGEGVARDIHIEDKNFPADTFELVEGSFSGEIAQIASGENATFSFTVVPLRLGEHRDESAIVTYRKAEGAEPTTAYSSFIGTIFILAETEYQNFYAEHTREWIIFFVLAVLPTGAPLVVYLQKKALAEKQKSN